MALRDCGPILVRFDHPGFIALYEAGVADATPFGDDDEAVIYRLNAAGWQALDLRRGA